MKTQQTDKRRKYTKESLEEAVKHCKSYADVVRYFGNKPHGSTGNNIKKRILEFGIDVSHFGKDTWNKGLKQPHTRKNKEDILVFDKNKNTRTKHYMLYRSLLEIGREEKCEQCKIGTEWNGLKLTLQVDHIDGNCINNLPDNLRILCPNCHSQTENFGSKGLKINRDRFCKCGKKIGRKNKSGICKGCLNHNVHNIFLKSKMEACDNW